MLVMLFGFLGLNPSAVRAAGNTYFVTDTGGAANACTTGDPCSLSHAVDLATDGDEIRVASGTYAGVGSDPVLRVTESLTVTGGYLYNSGAGTWSATADPGNITTLDGNDDGPVVEIGAGASPIIENFHVQNGRSVDGAGIYIEDGDGRAVIRYNAIHHNTATGSTLGGGGIYDGGGSTIAYNDIYSNTAASNGAGIYLHNDSATISSTIEFNNIYLNTASGSGTNFGGGVFMFFNANGHFVGNRIHENSADIGGGLGVNGAQFSMYSNLMYLNEAINSNTSSAVGGAIWSSGNGFIWNNTIASNSANGDGAGLHLEFGTVEIHNTIIALNTGPGNNGLNNDDGAPATISGTYNLLSDNIDAAVSFTNDVIGDPAFVNAAGQNFHITSGSAARNTGSPSTPDDVNLDIDEQLRPNPDDLSLQDVGADEYYADFREVSIEPTTEINFVERGTTAVFTHTLRNEGSLSDTYNISCANDAWSIDSCSGPIGPVNPGEEFSFTTQVLVPAGAAAYDAAFTYITATSQADSGVFARAVVHSTVMPHPGVSFTPNYTRTELPGELITLTHVLTNTGDAFENFIVTIDFDTNGWGELIPSEPLTVGLNSGQFQNVQVRIQVPPFADAGFENIVRLKATSQFSPTIFDTVVNTITAKATVGTRYVKIGESDDDNNCTQSNKPCATIDHAVGQAASGDEIRIAPGIYNENDIEVNDVFYISGGWNNFRDDGQGDEPDPGLTIIDAESAGPAFVINTAKPEISVLTMENGRNANGGAVLVNSSAEPKFSNVIFRGNQAQTRGGALFVSNNSTVSIEKSAFVTNTSTDSSGGAIYLNGGNLFLRQSSFLTNTAPSADGGAFAMTGGSFTGQNNLFFNNETASGNGGAVSLNGGTASLNFSTWVENNASGNGGGVFNNGATLTVTNSIFSGNDDGSGNAIFESSGSTGLDYLDMWQNSSNVPVGPNSFTADPLFADEEFRLGIGSPAIDTANPASTLAVDFEDDDRPADEGFDIGYDERAGCRTKRDDITYGSIQAAVDVDSTDNTILVSGICRGVHTIDYQGQTISQTVHLTKSLVIQGGWNSDFSKRFEEVTQVDPEGRGRAFFISDGVSVTIEAISVTNGSAAGLGGGPVDEDAGGAFYNVDGQVTLRGVKILTGTADLGAGFYNDAGSPLLTWLYIERDPNNNNEESYILTELAQGTAVSGGGVYNNIGELVVDGAWLHHNQATSGGGLFNFAGPITVTNVIFDNNTATDGAGLYNLAAAASYLHMTVYSNIASSNGGGFYNAAGQPFIHSSIFESNQATGDGSAIYDAVAGTGSDPDYNYYYNNSGSTVFGTVTGTNSIVSLVAPGLTDPGLGDFHLVDDAPAADVADPLSPIPTDFEDDPRPSNQGFDMGADEILGCLVQVGDTIYGSLQAAINAANPGDVIKVSGDCSGVHPFSTGSATVCGGDIQTAVHITKELTLLGGWDEDFNEQQEGVYSVLDAKTLGRVMYIGQGVSVTVESFAMINGVAADGAGICIDDGAQPSLRNNRVYSNTASNDGGGIYSLNSQTLLEDGNHIYENEASGDGGGLYLTGSGVITAAVQNNFIYNNIADSGAGIYNASGDHVYWHNTLYGNIAANTGGGFAIPDGSPDIRGNILMANEANSGSGALNATTAGSPTIDYNDYYQNSPAHAPLQPGDISVDPEFANIISGVFTITIDSPVVDIEIPDMPLQKDFEDDIRPSHQAFDLGADEVGGCFATIQGQEDIVFGSVQLAVETAVSGDTVLVDGICQNVNRQLVSGNNISQTLFIDKDLTIDGSWEYPDDDSTVTTTLQANGKGRVVYVDAGVTVSITNIILRDGDASLAGDTNDNGGGVYNNGTLNIIKAWVQENTAVSGGGIFNDGILTLDESHVLTNTVTQNGGGIYNNANATIQNNTIRANSADNNGGGIYQQAGNLTVDKNRINGNSADGSGGGLYLNSGGSIEVRNNFIYNNGASTGGGLYNANTNANIWHNTFYNNTAQSNNGGGLANAGGSPNIRNNIVDRNNGVGLFASGGSPTANYNNVVGNSLGNYNPSTLQGANDISQFPDYQAPGQEDFHLLQGSPGEDIGDLSVPVPDDIDGDLRPTNGGPDMGADEINSCLIRVGGADGEIFGVLQDAIDYAYSANETSVEIARGECRGVKYNPASDTWQVGFITSTLNFTGSLRRSDFADLGDYYNPEINRLTTMINADNEGHVLYIANGASPTFYQIAFVEGNAVAGGGNHGGAIHKAGVGQVRFYLNYFCDSTAQNGGGIYINPSASMDISGARVGNCYVKQLTEDENGDIDESRTRTIYFDGNIASGNGGGFYTDGNMSARNVGVFTNTASLNGGGGYSNQNGNELINVIFYDNIAAGTGGGLHNVGSNVDVLHNTIYENIANDGGGIYNSGSDFLLNSSIVYSNTADPGTGGGISNSGSNASLNYNNFYINTPNDHPGLTNNNAIIGEPGLLYDSYVLSVHSINIDRADPNLLLLPAPIDYDYRLDDRPDGDEFLDYQPPHGIFSDVGADEYFKDFGCEITASDNERTAAPGDTVTYTLTIINTGNPSYLDLEDTFLEPHGYTDTITVTISSQTQGWSSLEGGDDQSVLLGWNDDYRLILDGTFDYFFGETITRVLTVTVPDGIEAGTSEVTTIQCQSHSLPNRTDTATIRTNVGEVGGVSVEPSYIDEAYPGEVRVYTQTVTNLQNTQATYLLTAKSGLQHANAVLLDSDTMLPVPNITVTLQPSGTVGYTTTAYLQVTILDTAIAGDIANPGLVATDISSGLFDSSNNQTTILSAPATRYVAGDSGSNTTNCADPFQPCATIQYAIQMADDENGNIDEIKVAAFTYADYTTATVGADTVEQVLFVNKSVSISGGYTTTEQVPFTTQYPITNAVKLNGQNARRVIYVTDGVTPTLSSLFIENGYAAPFSTISGTYGSGIYNAGADLTIHSSWIQYNTAAYGAGIFHEDGLLTMYSNILNSNSNPDSAIGEGAGLYLASGTGLIENNTFVFNVADNDSPSSPTPNTPTAAATGFGGGIFLDDPADASVTNNIFSNNGAEQGTAIYISGTATITNSYNLYDQPDPNSSIVEGGSLGANAIEDNPQFVSFSDYHIMGTSPARDAGTPTVSISQSVDIDLEPRFMGVQIDIGADEWTQRPGIVFVPTPLSATIDSGAVVTYNHWLTNTGNFTDSFSLSMVNQVTPPGDLTWDYYLEPTTIDDLAPLAGVQVTLVVTGGQPGYVDVTTITAASASISASVEDTTIISQTAGVDIEASEFGSGVPGELITYTHTLTNTGDGLDEFVLTATAVPDTWTYTLTPTQPVFVPAGESIPFTVTVLIPTDAVSGTQHILEVTASATDPDASDILTDTTTVELDTGLTLIPDHTRAVPDGTTTVYTHTLTSYTNIVDTITLTATGDLPGWLVTIEPESVMLNPTESEIITVTVNVPPDTGGLTHVTQITATSSLPGVMATATDTTTVPVETGILFTPNLTESVYAGSTAYYTHTLTNLGNLTDTFDLTNSSTQGWLQSITPGPLTVGPGASVQVTAVISVPPTALVGTVDLLEITATSQAVTATTATVTDTTQVIQFVDLTFIPDHDDTGDPGTTKVYTHTLTNDGDGEDTFNLTYSGNPPWTVTLEPSTAITLAMGETAVVTANLIIPVNGSGLTNVTYITATSSINPAVSATVVNTTTVTGEPVTLGVLIEPDRSAIGSLNETITYYHTVTNTGDVPDDIGLSVASGWTAIVTPTQILGLPNGASAPVTVTVTIPGSATPGEEDLAVVTAVSLTNPDVNSSVTDTTRVEQNHGLLFYPDNATTTDPNTTVVYTHTLHNTGDGPDTFAITPDSSQGWATAVDSPVTLEANMSTTIYITLTVPPGTESQVDVMLVTATSTISPTYSAVVTNTTTVTGVPPVIGVDIEPDNMGYGRVGDSIQYVHTVTNTGNAPDTFDITVDSSLGWTPTIEPQPPVLNLADGESALVTITLTIPPNGLGAQDVTTVTVTSQTNNAVSDFAVDTTYAPAVFLPIILKPDVTIPPTNTPTPTASPTACAPTGRDLVVTEIRVEPAVPVAGQPATVFVTIKNQGSVDVAYGNNFYADFYVDRVPARYLRGNIIWGVQGEWMGAGESRTLSRSYTFSGGSHQLWAQVDTDDTVNECPFENNNIRGPISLTVSGSANVPGQDDLPQQAEPNDGPRHTPTPEANLPSTTPQPVTTAVLSSTPIPTFTVTPLPPGED